jgi:hypothetical protein
MLKYYILIINIILSYSFNLKLSRSTNDLSNIHILPSLYNEWHCIGFNNNIDKSKPYHFNIGSLQIITHFKNDTNNTLNPLTTIILNPLKCINKMNYEIYLNILSIKYNLEYVEQNIYGTTLFYQDRLWWSYKPLKKLPPYLPFYNDKNYNLLPIELDINANIIDCIINNMNINIYNKTFEYLNINYNKKIKLSDNYLYYNYPSTMWYKIYTPLDLQKQKYKNIIININMTPINLNKTKWYIIIINNKNKLKNYNIKKEIYNILYNFIKKLSIQNKLLILNNTIYNYYFKKILLIYNYTNIENILKLFYYKK